MQKFRTQTIINLERRNHARASIKEHEGKYYVLASIVYTIESFYFEGKEYTEVFCLFLNQLDNEYWYAN